MRKCKKKRQKRDYQIISKILTSDNPTKTLKDLAKTLKIHESTLYRWLKKYKEDEEKFSALFPAYWKRGGKGKSRMPEDVEKMMESVIQEVYLNPTRRVSVVTAYKILQQRCKERGIKAPSLNIFRARINRLDMFEVSKRRLGKAIAQGLYGASEKSLEVNYPLELV